MVPSQNLQSCGAVFRPMDDWAAIGQYNHLPIVADGRTMANNQIGIFFNKVGQPTLYINGVGRSNGNNFIVLLLQVVYFGANIIQFPKNIVGVFQHNSSVII